MLQVWTRPVLPTGSVAIAVLNKGHSGNSVKVDFPLKMYGLESTVYDLTEVFDGQSLGRYNISSVVTFYVNPTGIYMFLAKPVSV